MSSILVLPLPHIVKRKVPSLVRDDRIFLLSAPAARSEVTGGLHSSCQASAKPRLSSPSQRIRLYEGAERLPFFFRSRARRLLTFPRSIYIFFFEDKLLFKFSLRRERTMMEGVERGISPFSLEPARISPLDRSSPTILLPPSVAPLPFSFFVWRYGESGVIVEPCRAAGRFVRPRPHCLRSDVFHR